MKPVPHGEPYAGKLHVRFDEGYPPKNGEARFEGSRRPSGRSPRGVPLYSTPSESQNCYNTENKQESFVSTGLRNECCTGHWIVGK